MSINASEITSVTNMSTANIAAKRDLRHWLRDRSPALTACVDALGDDPELCAENADPDRSQIQHVDLGGHHADIGRANALVSEAYNILANMHNNMTAQGEAAGIVMNAPNGGGGR